MTKTEENTRKKYFHDDMVKYYKLTVKEVKYKPARRFDLINKYGGYEAAIKILPTDSNTFDFTLLWESQRLDLSIEALVTKEIYKELFPEHIVVFCQKRLDEYNYAPKKIIEVVEDPEITPYEEVLQSKLDDEKMTAFIDDLFENSDEIIAEPDQVSKVLTPQVWDTLCKDSKIFTPANLDLIIKISKYNDGLLTPTTLTQLDGYTETYPLYNVVTSLAKRIKRIMKLDLNELGIEEKEIWKLVFHGEFPSAKMYKLSIREQLKRIFIEN